jgi:predicted CoA-binding protein
MNESDRIQTFLAGRRFAVVGASSSREKYGNKVLRAYLQDGRDAVPVNPAGGEIEGLTAATSLAAVPGEIDGVSIITPPPVTEKVVDQAIERGIKHIWMQPGAESANAIERAEQSGASVIAGGPCILVTLRYRESNG